jgi:NADP-dependent 3-hydroxy acid dehydrogenase YdfG
MKEVAIQAGNNFEPITLDINDETAIHDWYNNTFTNVNTPDILINNAGIGFQRLMKRQHPSGLK